MYDLFMAFIALTIGGAAFVFAAMALGLSPAAGVASLLVGAAIALYVFKNRA